MNKEAPSAPLARIRLYPIKSLDPVEVTEARIGPNGGLEHDRAWALYSADGRWMNAKRSPAIHCIRAAFAADIRSVTLTSEASDRPLPPATLDFPGNTQCAAAWFSKFFGEPIEVRHSTAGFPDDDLAPGPTIVSTASLETICRWFPGVSEEQARLRFRASLEIAGVPSFWEDQLFGADERTIVRFRVGEVLFEGSNPCARCAVPPRDPATGATIETFQKRFAELRRAELPAWAPEARFDHFYRFAVNTRVPRSETGRTLRAGDLLAPL